ncbi:MAG: hypothetical protein BWY87_00026 [Deltaproteobacteria bacterium ADurb.Bin510]|nr:MAG: hypothetical protein BWY87_00026 [Deltaproteobacteria bacterium ADurb.Bin510]
MRLILKRLSVFLRYCLKPEDSCATTDWLSVDCGPEAGAGLKCLVWIGAVAALAMALF